MCFYVAQRLDNSVVIEAADHSAQAGQAVRHHFAGLFRGLPQRNAHTPIVASTSDNHRAQVAIREYTIE
jgi:hypothetical protein